MTDEDISGQLLALEDRFWNAMKQRDGASAVTMTMDSSLVVGAQGIGEIDRPSLKTMIEQAPYELAGYRFDDTRVRQISDDVAVVSYKVTEDLVLEGQKLVLEAFDSTVWVRSGDSWLCALHTETPAGDPFGRR
jgi:hypothetical protein